MRNRSMITGSALGRIMNCVLPAIVLWAALLCVWEQQCVARKIPEWMLAKPSDIFSAFISNFSEAAPL